MNTAKQISRYLLQSKSIKLQPSNPFTWASGWLSPIYCDNRRTLSFPEIRNFLKKSFSALILSEFPGAEVIAGVATGAIAQGALVADELNLPFIYVRSSSKDHGLQNRIEGHLEKGKKVVVVEDLVSTGGSSLSAVRALRDAGASVLGMTAIFTYGFNVAEENFKNENCRLITLGNYHDLVNEARESGYISENESKILMEWRKDPENWKKEN